MASRSRKLRNAPGISSLTFTQFPVHETIWAMAAGPDELVHVALCCENTGGGTVQMFAYNTKTRALKHVLDVTKAIGEDPNDGHATQGKVHFSLCPSRDGFVYAATHASTPPLGDTIWKAQTMWNDRQKSYRGSHYFRYHPRTGEARDFGIVCPNQGIGAMDLDEDLGVLCAVTYPKGNLFFIEKDGSRFQDMGRISETYNLAMICDRRGFAYTTDSYGYLVRINLKKRTWEMLQTRSPQFQDASGRSTWMSDAVLGPDGCIYGAGYSTSHLFRFKPAAAGPIAMEDLGCLFPQDRPGGRVKGLVFGKDGKLYADFYGAYPDEKYTAGLVRFDPRTRTVEALGPLFTEATVRHYWRAVLGADGRIYAGECGRKPDNLIIIDPAQVQARSAKQ